MNFLLSLFFLSSSYAADCQKSLNCFLEAIPSCNQAQVFVEYSSATPEIEFKVKKQLVLQGKEKGNCLYEELTQSVSFEMPFGKRQELSKQGWSEDLIQGQLRSTAASLGLAKGLSYECVLTPEKLEELVKVNYLDKKPSPTFFSSCTKTQMEISKPVQATEKPEENLEEKQAQEEEEEAEEYGEVPELLSYPHKTDFVRALKNSLADISPYLGRKIPSAPVLWQKSKEHPLPQIETPTAETSAEELPLLGLKTITPQMEAPPVAPLAKLPPERNIFEKRENLTLSERNRIILYGRTPPPGKPRLSAELSYDELSKRGLSNDEIGAYALKAIQNKKNILESQISCSSSTSCPQGLSCHPYFKKCLECSIAEHCPGDQFCHNYKCVPSTTVVNP